MIIPDQDWAAMWAPYDEDTYRQAATWIKAGQRVLDIGAGDLRFARRLTAQGCRVIAIDNQWSILMRSLQDGPLPSGLLAVCADARGFPFPSGMDTAVLLMRHCMDFGLYVRKLREVGCLSLITNARWGMGVEYVPLEPATPTLDAASTIGWYACLTCGKIGFQASDPNAIDDSVLDQTLNIEACPVCQGFTSQ
ncbi:MAG: rRNA adenine methyltransferase [Chloroflexi bacterium]|nr:rRNA adenine methyltransferase [Chloroflexota bacterium]